jgi:hypothetical protein
MALTWLAHSIVTTNDDVATGTVRAVGDWTSKGAILVTLFASVNGAGVSRTPSTYTMTCALATASSAPVTMVVASFIVVWCVCSSDWS